MSGGRLWACVECGYQGRRPSEVKVGLVEYSDPIPVEVAIPIGETQRGPARIDYERVPGRYGAVPRCTDLTACAARITAQASEAAVEAFFGEGMIGEHGPELVVLPTRR